MRNKKFYDRLHELDKNFEKMRCNPDYIKVVKADRARYFMDNFYSFIIEYDLIEYYFKGVPKSEIIDGIAFVHDIENNTNIKHAIASRVKDEISSIIHEIKDAKEKKILKMAECGDITISSDDTWDDFILDKKNI